MTKTLSNAEQERKWKAQADLGALIAAKEVQADKARLAAARQMAQEQVAAAKKAASVVGRTRSNGNGKKEK